MPDGVHRSPRLPPLDRFSGLRQLGARLIRMAMRGDLDIDTASKLMNMTRVQGELIQAEMLEKRLDRLEGSVQAGFKPDFVTLKRLKEAA